MAKKIPDKSGRMRVGSGKPPTYESPQELIEAIVSYLDEVEEDSITVTGLALSLGFASRQSLFDYEKKPEYSYIIKRAKLIVENGYETDLKGGKMSAIFPLKNMGWSDKQEIESHNTTELTVAEQYPNLEGLSPEELDLLTELSKKAKGDDE